MLITPAMDLSEEVHRLYSDYLQDLIDPASAYMVYDIPSDEYYSENGVRYYGRDHLIELLNELGFNCKDIMIFRSDDEGNANTLFPIFSNNELFNILTICEKTAKRS